MELTGLSFDTIYLYGFSYSSLILNSTYLADSLVVNKPDLEIKEQEAEKPVKKPSKAFNPDHLLTLLGQGTYENVNKKVKIGEIRIDYGMANIAPAKSTGGAAKVVDFDITIKDLSTLPEDLKKPGRVLYSDDIQFEVKNINKVMISGYDIDLGSFFFSIKKNKLEITDVKLFPESLSDSINQIALNAKLIEFNGLSLNELRGKEEIQLSSARISDGYFITNTHHGQTNGRHVHNAVFQKFAKDIVAFKLDTLGIEHFDLRFLEYLRDTISYVQDFNMELYGFELDSSMLDDVYREVIFEEFVISSGKGAYKIEADDLLISLDSSNYSSVSEIAEFYQLNASDPQSTDDLNVSAGKISIAGLTQEMVPYPDKLQLIFTIEDVQANLNLSHQIFQKKSKRGSNNIIDLLNIKRIHLVNANIDLFNDQKFDLQLSGLHTSIDNPLQISDDKIHPNLKGLDLNVNSLSFNFGSRIRLTSGLISFANNDFKINHLAIHYNKSSATSHLRMDNLSLNGFLLEEFINNKQLKIDEIILGQTKLSGDLAIPSNTPQKETPIAEASPVKLPFESLSIGHFKLIDLQINNKLILAEEEIDIRSDIDINLKEIALYGPDISKNELANIKGRISFSGGSPDAFGHALNLGKLMLDLSNEKFLIKNLDIKYLLDDKGKYKNIINNLQLSLLQFDQLNYALLLEKEIIQFHKLQLNDLALDIVMEPGKAANQDGPRKEFDINDYLQIDTTLMVFENIDLKIEVKGDSSGPLISLHDFDLKYAQSEEIEKNFMSGIDFSFENFAFTDKIKHSFYAIESGNFDSRDYDLQLNNISGGTLQKNATEDENTKGWSFTSTKLLIENIFIKNTLPSRIDMDKLSISESKLVISNKKDKEKKPGLKLDLEAFNEFGNLMTKLSVDTTVFNEIKVHYKSFDDTTSHVFVADSIGLTLHNINIDSTVLDNNNVGLLKQMNIDFKGRTRISKDSLYEIRSGLLSYNFQDDIITIDSFRLLPRFEEKEFFERAHYQTDRMNIFGQYIKFHDFRLEELFKDDLIHFGWIEVDSLNLKMVRDKRYPLKGDYKPMPQQMLASMAQKILIDSVSVIDSYMKYGEYDKKSILPGSVFFDRFNLSIHNITNLHPLPANKSSIKVNLNTYIMGKARLDLAMAISYVGADSNFTFKASSEPLDLTTLNPLTENLLGITIRSGTGHVQESDVTGNALHSEGNMIFIYKNMKLGLYSRSKDHQNKGIFAGLTRFLINDIFIPSNNPKFARKPRTGMVYFKRDPQKSFINYTWKSLLSGIMSTAGINKKEQRQEKKEIKNQEKTD